MDPIENLWDFSANSSCDRFQEGFSYHESTTVTRLAGGARKNDTVPQNEGPPQKTRFFFQPFFNISGKSEGQQFCKRARNPLVSYSWV